MAEVSNPPPKELYANAIATARQVFSLSHLSSNGQQNVSNRITTDVINAFRWCAREMPDEEESLSSADVQELLADVRALIASFEQSTIRPGIRGFVLEQLRLVERALRTHRIVRGKELAATLIRVRYEVSQRSTEIKEVEERATSDADKGAWDGLRRFGVRLFAVAEKTEKLLKLIKTGFEVAKEASNYFLK